MIPNVFVSISGDPKSGKTHLALTFPEPIVVYSFDLRGAELLVGKDEFKGKQIDVRNFMPPITDTMQPTQEDLTFWEKIKKDYQATIEGGKFKTVVIDPSTIVWEIIRNAWEVERGMGKLLSRDYGVPNSRMTWMMMSPLTIGMNVVTIQYLREQYVGDKATGLMVLDGFKRTEGLADLVVFTEMIGKKEKSLVKCTLEHCRFDRTLNGTELTDTCYEELMTLLGVEA